MGRMPKFETKMDDLRVLDIKFLRENDYLSRGVTSGTLTWTKGSQKTAAITATVVLS